MSTTQTVTVAPAKTEVTAEVPFEELSLSRLRDAIPDHCFRPSWAKTLGYLSRDLCLMTLILALGWLGIANIPSATLRWLLWPIYGFCQGLVFTGLWQIGHEMGHGSLLPSPLCSNIFGFVLHSCLLTPFFAWRSTHAKHHRYNVHMEKDPNHIPDRFTKDGPTQSEHITQTVLDQVDEWVEDAPLFVLFRVILLQMVGWPMHIAFTVSGGETSCDYRHKDSSATWMPDWLRKSHYNPIGSNFRTDETLLVILSDVGIAATIAWLYNFGCTYGFGLAFLLFVQPWMWLNHWIIAVTFLHHTHPDVPKYEAESWTYMKSALATIDRDFGLIGTFFFHNVIPHHVVHHLFPRIPFFHAAEATAAIRPILGKSYHRDTTSFMYAYWREYKTCRWVVSDDAERPEDQALWFVDGNGRLLSDKSAQHFSTLRKRLTT